MPYFTSLNQQSVLSEHWRWERLDNEKIKDVETGGVPEARYSFSLLLYEKGPT